jgi:radical SAM-linked protein
MKAQRLRLRYRLFPPATDLRPRDLTAAWSDALTSAGLAVALSEGKRPTPLVALAATLTQGSTSDFELLDVFLSEPVDPSAVACQVAPHLPAGIDIVGSSEVGVNAASLQSQLRWAEYEVDVPTNGTSLSDVRAAVERLLAATTLPSEYRRETKVRAYDLRPLILDLRVEATSPGAQALSLTGGGEGSSLRLRMRLRAEQENTARADQVILALGLPPATRVHRTRIGLSDTSPVLQAYRRGGERVVY